VGTGFAATVDVERRDEAQVREIDAATSSCAPSTFEAELMNTRTEFRCSRPVRR